MGLEKTIDTGFRDKIAVRIGDLPEFGIRTAQGYAIDYHRVPRPVVFVMTLFEGLYSVLIVRSSVGLGR